MKIKLFVLSVLSPVMLSLFFLKPNTVEVKADNNVETDMSSVPLISDEAIDTDNIIYDDFSSSTLNGNWVVSHRKWGGYDNKGVSADNVFLDTINDKVIIRALGNQHLENSTENGIGGPVSGGALVLKETARPGRYETRFKAAYKVGVCNAFWTYTENNLGQNHEIDIEFPFKDNSVNNAFNEVIFTNYIGESNFQQTHKTLDFYLNDGEYHTYAFDWYYSNNHKEIRYYIDSNLLATHTISSKLPFLPSRLWLGCWVPNNPGFVGLPNFDECFMEIDYFKYSPFLNQDESTTGRAGGCGQTSLNYHINDGKYDKYDWMSNGSFPAVAKNQSLEDRGYEVSGETRLYNGYDHKGSSNSGGLKMSANSSISYMIDSTYQDFKFKLSAFYKGEGTVNISFYDKSENLINNLPVVLPSMDDWSLFAYRFAVPNNTFSTKVGFSTSSHELYLDDISVVFSDDEPIEEIALLSITLEGPNKTTYKVGDTLDLSGLIVTGHYSDGNSKVITDYKVGDVDMSIGGTKTVVITCGDQTATFNIIVDEEGQSSITLKSVALEGKYKTSYLVGEELDLTGLIVKAHYSDGSSKEVTNYQVGSVDMSTAGTKRVNIIYIDIMVYYEIKVSNPASIPSLSCGGDIIMTSSLLSILAALGIALITFKRKH